MQCVLFIAFILFGGTTQQLDRNALHIFSQQTASRKTYLENDMVQRWSAIDQTQEAITEQVLRYLDDQQLSYADLTPEHPQTAPLLEQLSAPLIDLLRRNTTTGAFVIFNGDADLARPAGDAARSMAGLYFRDTSPKAAPAANSDLLVTCSPAGLGRELMLNTAIDWMPIIAVNAQSDAYYKPVLAALDHPTLSASDLGFWGMPNMSLHEQDQVVTYTRPLLSPDGVPYGVLGIELTLDYLVQQLPHGELSHQGDAAYLLAVTTQARPDVLSMQPVVISAHDAEAMFDQTALLRFDGAPYDNTFHQMKEDSTQLAGPVYGSIQYLSLYRSSSPFYAQHWAVVGVSNAASLFSFSATVMGKMLALSLALLLVGIAAALIAGSVFSAPIRALAREVRTLDPNHPVQLKPTNVREIDELASSIELLSRDVAQASSRLSKIVELTQIPLAAFQISPDLPCAYYTNEFFSLIGQPEPDRSLTAQEFLQVLALLAVYKEEGTQDGATVYKLPDRHASTYRWLRLQTVHNDQATLGVLVDVTKEVVEKRRIEYERDYDLLTRLLNRRAFQSRLERLQTQSEPLGCGAMVMLDLDNLKYLNDTYGHDCGDEYIRCAADVLRKFIIYNALVGRISGDEFYLFFSGYPGQEELQKIIVQLKSEMAAAAIRLPDGESYPLRASAGVAWYPNDSTSLVELIRFADFAMYEAKHASKGGMRNFDIQSYRRDSFLLYSRGELNRILDEDAVAFAFQPIICCASGRILGYEALMRPRSTAIPSSSDLIRIARSQSKLHEIERLSWFKGVAAFSALPEKTDDCLCFINSIASQSLTLEELDQFEHQFSPYLSRLVVELTEGDEVNTDTPLLKHQRYRKTRMRIAMDDFGTGYSNDSVLLAINPDFVKVDINIIRGIDQDKNRQTMLRNLVSLCHDMQVQVIAEGVETAEELHTVVRLGADYLQGYYLSKPAFQPEMVPDGVRQELHDAWLDRLPDSSQPL